MHGLEAGSMPDIQQKIIRIFLAVLIFMAGCSEEPTITDDYGMADFEELWSVTDTWYSFFEFKKLDWDSIYLVYQPGFASITKADKEALLGDLLNELKDGHANLFDENDNYISYYRSPRSLKNEVLLYVNETEGLIIDIRHNGGGSTNASDYFVSRLISETLEGSLWTRRGGGYFPLRYYYPAGDFQYTRPTVLLINGKSYSTSEAMANLCKKIENITVIGDTTGGGGGVPDEKFDLPSGLKFRVPTRCAMRYDGEHVEWNGIPPDIRISQTKADIDDNRDIQLEYAVSYLKANQPDGSFKNRYTWQKKRHL